MLTVKEVSRITGVTVRTLHHYDAVGLLKPAKVTQAGYRLYDEATLERLQSILLFRELQFPLSEIKEILDSPQFDREEALAQQLHLLEMQRERINRLIDLAKEMQRGENTMAFDAFDTNELEQYKAEAKERWGNTAAWKESQEKDPGAMADASTGLMALLAEFGELRTLDPSDARAEEKVRELQSYITAHFYTCTDDILYGLGQMYVADERFKTNIDRAGGEGTAAFVQKAIEYTLLK